MNIKNKINNNCINLDLKSTNKDDILKELIEMLYKNGVIDDKAGFFEDVCIRERAGSTGIGNYIAIPHGKSKHVKGFSMVIGRSKYGIGWGSIDNLPVNLFILFAVSNTEESKAELKLMSEVCIKLADDDLCEKLLSANTNEEIVEILSQ